ncbi:MAG: hypothetical protein AB4062_20830 [Crocosphaera sp.]
MMKIGTVIRVISPEYVAGFMAIITAKEINKRWIVRLKHSFFTDKKEVVLLSLNESEFEVIEET